MWSPKVTVSIETPKVLVHTKLCKMTMTISAHENPDENNTDN